MYGPPEGKTIRFASSSKAIDNFKRYATFCTQRGKGKRFLFSFRLASQGPWDTANGSRDTDKCSQRISNLATRQEHVSFGGAGRRAKCQQGGSITELSHVLVIVAFTIGEREDLDQLISTAWKPGLAGLLENT